MGPAEISAHPVALGECHLVMFDFISRCAHGCEEGTGKIRDCGRCETWCSCRCWQWGSVSAELALKESLPFQSYVAGAINTLCHLQPSGSGGTGQELQL